MQIRIYTEKFCYLIGISDRNKKQIFKIQYCTIIYFCKRSTVKVWQLNTGELIHTFNGHSAEVYAIAFSADGKTLVSGGRDKTIKIWQLP
ncbi:MAG: hypothetical protein V7K65_30430 [Nostoc sp.]